MSNKYVMVDGSPSYARDMETGGIININKEEIEAAREAKRRRKNKEQEFQDLKNEVGEIKELLNRLVEKL